MPKFYEIKNQTETSNDLYIYGDIVTEKRMEWDGKEWRPSETDVDLKDFRELVEGMTGNQTLNIFLNSGGGSVFAASAMVSMLKRAQARGVKVVSYIDGLAASAASLFPMVSDESHIYANSMLMIHKPLASLLFAMMNANELNKLADELESIENGTLVPIYKSRTKLTDQKLKNAIANETWFTAEEIMENFDGFTLHDEEKAAAACTSDFFAKYKNTPKAYSEIADQTPADQTPEPIPVPGEDNKKDIPDMKSVYQEYLNSLQKGKLQ